ncbi:hypothetical protein SPHINGO8BC_90560 [Sphingobacterium multivorum]|uniref:Uncharacterized protein n=1 Tax=Sphingobacterium multivorum TaxID=28454 RepID=A0A654DRA9_SPHMU|nr:hypothetical protein SPHINGO8BC_90560 [Sphingobacterium multivorum]
MSEFTIETLLVKCHSIQDLNEYLANIQIPFIQYKYVSNKTLDYVNIWFMTNYSKIEIEIINISLGLTVKLRRLEYKYSQLDLGIISETDNWFYPKTPVCLLFTFHGAKVGRVLKGSKRSCKFEKKISTRWVVFVFQNLVHPRR